MKIRYRTGLLATVFLLAACGGDDSNDCEVWGEEVCALGCDCAAGDACAFIAGAVTLTFENESDCAGFFSGQLACHDGGDPDFDYAGCTDMLDQAMCVDTDDDVGAVQLPPCAE
ncbi:MAG TPA: hypothetical protein VMZ28_06165 [Kofleriaceae bacterium]|nr:hypothetical protein [Kofleriaceae bacterium]